MRREPRIIPIGPGQLTRTVAMHRRCSPQTLWSRYHRAMADPRTYVPTLLSRPGSVHLAALGATGRIVAVGHLMPDHTAAEAALLVEDSWQGRGLGTRLLRPGPVSGPGSTSPPEPPREPNRFPWRIHGQGWCVAPGSHQDRTKAGANVGADGDTCGDG